MRLNKKWLEVSKIFESVSEICSALELTLKCEKLEISRSVLEYLSEVTDNQKHADGNLHYKAGLAFAHQGANKLAVKHYLLAESYSREPLRDLYNEYEVISLLLNRTGWVPGQLHCK